MRRLRMLTVAVLVAPSLALLAVGASTHPAAATATGGDTVTDVDVGGTTYRVHTFTTVGTQNLVVTAPVDIDVLIVAGGGGGGTRGGTTGQWAGGGGAGGMVEDDLTLPAGTYAIVVGGGGAGGTPAAYQGSNGGASSAFGLSATGGGGGAASSSGAGASRNGNAGGSGGGGAHDNGAGVGGVGIAGQGSDGGDGHQPIAGSCPNDADGCGGGGGGGASAVGVVASGMTGGAGGAGRASSITGVAVTYAGGGGGGGNDAARSGAGGAGGGGAGMAKDGSGSGAGAANTGGGAGAGPYAGGSGIVIVRYVVPAAAPAPVEVAPPSVGCAGTPVAGSAASCSVTGLPAGFEVLWRASVPAGEIASGVLVADDDGTAALMFALPPTAVGTPVTVELVDWTAPILIGVTEGPVPNAVDAGGGSTPDVVIIPLGLLLAVGAVVTVARRRDRVGTLGLRGTAS